MTLRLLYRSRHADRFGPEDVLRLLIDARARNARLQVTGILLCREDAFMQLLEGEADTVRRLYRRIAEDPRHRDLELVLEQDGLPRLLPAWRMAYAQAPMAAGSAVFERLDDEAGALRALEQVQPGPGVAQLRAFLAPEAA